MANCGFHELNTALQRRHIARSYGPFPQITKTVSKLPFGRATRYIHDWGPVSLKNALIVLVSTFFPALSDKSLKI
jgi:hypothetical protein